MEIVLCESVRGLSASGEGVRFKFMQNLLMSIASWKWARWPYSKSVAARLDSAQSHFTQIPFPVVFKADETPDAFFTRQRLQSGRLCSKMGRWSLFWVGALKSWHTHMRDQDFESSWGSQIFSSQTFADLEQLRADNSRAGRRGRTGTRSSQGNVSVRWVEAYELAKSQPSLKVKLPSKTRQFGA